MEKQDQNWTKSLRIIRDGKLFKVVGEAGPAFKGAFTTYSHAERFIKAYNNSRIDEIVKKETKRIKNSKDPIKKRMKDYKELCQAIPNYS